MVEETVKSEPNSLPQKAPNLDQDRVDHAETKSPQSGNQSDVTKTVTKVILGLCVFLFVWHLFADRLTPTTSNARVRAYVVPVAPEVAGKLTDIRVSFSQRVKEGDVLAVVDKRKYQYALEQAEAQLELAGQEIGASTGQVSSAEAKLAQREAQLVFVQQQAARYKKLSETGVISVADAEKSETELQKAEADVKAAQADLEKAKEQLGVNGENNPKIRKAVAALRQAHLDLNNTEIRATSDGIITNVNLEVGQYANPGQPLMTLLSQKDVWIEAYMRENNLGNIRIGSEVDVTLDIAPGKVFKAEVVSVTLGVDWGPAAHATGVLPSVPSLGGWLREPQLFPVIIRFKQDISNNLRIEGGQADIAIYTGENPLLNGLAWAQIRIKSYLSYIY